MLKFPETITLKQLKLFDAIARHNNFSAAANEASLSQPAVSLQIKKLEETIGLPLYEKYNKQIRLTAVGKIVLETSRSVQSRMEQMYADIDYLKGDIRGPLNIAVVTSAKYFLPQFLSEFLALYPNVTPSMAVINRETILQSLAENKYNLYIMGRVAKNLKVQARPFLENILEVVASPQHPLCQQKNITLAELVKERFLVREKGSGTRKAIDRLFAGEKLTITPYMELGDTGAIKNAVMANLGISVLSRHSLQGELQTGSITVLNAKDFPLHRHWYAIYPSEKSLSIVTRTFLDFLMTKEAE